MEIRHGIAPRTISERLERKFCDLFDMHKDMDSLYVDATKLLSTLLEFYDELPGDDAIGCLLAINGVLHLADDTAKT